MRNQHETKSVFQDSNSPFGIYRSIEGTLDSKSGSPNEIPVLRNESVIADQSTGQEVVIGTMNRDR
ncbi:MAG: hypothetical protein ACFFD4_04115 [Candidatus Odinarchaeota archaeon]